MKPSPASIAFRDDLLALLNKHTGEEDSAVMLATAAYSLGQMLAMLDATKWHPAAAMELIARNIELGNADAINNAKKWMGSA